MKNTPMRILLLILLFVVASSSITQAQEPVEQLDTIMLISKRRVIGKVQKVSPSAIVYFPKGKQQTVEMARKQIHKIFYANGRIESFNTLAVEMVDEKSWKTVIISDNKDDVEGLYPLGNVDAQSSPRSRTAKSAKSSAEIRMKKKAVNMGAIIILVTRRESKGGYNEIPTHFVEGIAYGFEPPAQ
jgi:hypothetical protein